MTKVIAFANNKGGSGKTTTCSNVGCAMALLGKKVLLIDGDMQLNLTISYFDEEQAHTFAESGKNLFTAIREERSLSEFLTHTSFEGLDMVPSTSLMSGIEFELFSKWQRETVLRKCPKEVKERGDYDYILIDAPPTLGVWVMNILCASDFVLVPAEASPTLRACEYVRIHRKSEGDLPADGDFGHRRHQGGRAQEIFQTDIGDLEVSRRDAAL